MHQENPSPFSVSRRALLATAVAGGLVGWSRTGLTAESFPSKPLKLIVPFPPGGPSDVIARSVGQIAANALRQPIVIDNRAGAGGTIGTGAVATAPADGYTIGLAAVSGLAIAPHLYKNLSYNVERDLQPLTLAAIVKGAILAHPSTPFNDVKGLVAYAKANPGKLSYASSGVGTANHLAAELFEAMAGIRMTHIPYRGTGPATNDLLAGVVPLLFESSLLSAAQHAKAGKVKVLAITAATRSPLMPDVPTVAESGYPGFDAPTWFGFVAPKNTPKHIAEMWTQALHQALNDPALKDRLAEIGAETAPNTPAEFARYIRQETEMWGRLIRDKNIVIE